MAEDEFEAEDYGDAAEGMANSDIQARINELMKTPTCGLSECTAKQVDPAEEAWLKLMSAVPKNGQTTSITPAREIQSYALPNGESVQSLVRSLRPDPADEYSIEQISTEWKTAYGLFSDMPDDLKNGLSTLSEDWQGDDYDGFEEQVEKVIKNIRTVLADIWGEPDTIGGAVKILDEKSESIFAQQGGNQCVYPSPKFHLEDAAACSHKIHIRPAYFPACEVFPDDETKVAMEWAGFEPTIVDEVQEERERIYNAYTEHTTQYPEYEEDGMKGETLARTAGGRVRQGCDRRPRHRRAGRTAGAGHPGQRGHHRPPDQHQPGGLRDHPRGQHLRADRLQRGRNVDNPGSGGLDSGAPPGGGTPPGLGDMDKPGSPKPITPTTPTIPDTGDTTPATSTPQPPTLAASTTTLGRARLLTPTTFPVVWPPVVASAVAGVADCPAVAWAAVPVAASVAVPAAACPAAAWVPVWAA